MLVDLVEDGSKMLLDVAVVFAMVLLKFGDEVVNTLLICEEEFAVLVPGVTLVVCTAVEDCRRVCETDNDVAFVLGFADLVALLDVAERVLRDGIELFVCVKDDQAWLVDVEDASELVPNDEEFVDWKGTVLLLD